MRIYFKIILLFTSVLFLLFTLASSVNAKNLKISSNSNETKRRINDKEVTTKIADEKVRESREDVQLCDEDQLMIYLAEIDAINPESIINLITVEDMETMCTKVATNLVRMNCYMKHCEPPEQKDLYIQLIKGVNALHEKMCAPCPFKSEFEKYFECVQDLHEDFKQCTGPPDWTEYCTMKEVCIAYKNILDCYYIKTATLCGLKAAHLFKELGMSVINRIIERKCNNVLKDPHVKHPMPEEYVYSIGEPSVRVSNSLFIIIIINSVIIVINYLQI